TPSRTPLRPKITSYDINLTPRRVSTKSPTLTLSSALPAPVESKISPAKIAPETYNIGPDRAVKHAKSPCSVRQNLLNALTQDALSNTVSSDITSTNFEFKVPSATPSYGLTSASHKPTVETTSNVQNDSSFVAPKSTVAKRFQLKPPTLINKNVGPPLRVQNNNSFAGNLDTGNSKTKANSTSGNENGKRIPGYASLTKSAAQKITGKDMLPKRCHSKENTLPQPKRRRLPRSVSSSSLISDEQSKKRHKNHVTGLKRAVSVMHMRK
ncbi:Hypothetical predicted protein, partial [Paramuricea clavata]